MSAKSNKIARTKRLPSSSSNTSEEEKVTTSRKKKVESTPSSSDVKPSTRNMKTVQRKKPVSSSGSTSESEVNIRVRSPSAGIKPSSENTQDESSSETLVKKSIKTSKISKKKIISSSDSNSEEEKKSYKRKGKTFNRKKEKYSSSETEKDDDSSDPELEILETTEYKGSNRFSKLPSDILKVIANMLGGNDKLSLMRSSGLYQAIISKMHLDLSNRAINLSKLFKMKDELLQFKSLSLNIIIDDNTKKIKPLAHKITDLILYFGNNNTDINNFKDCPLRSLELNDITLTLSDILIFPYIEKITINFKYRGGKLHKKFEVLTNLKYLDITNINDTEQRLLESSMFNLETLILRNEGAENDIKVRYLNSCTKLAVLELHNYYNLTDFSFLEHLKNLERFVFILDERKFIFPINTNLTFKTPDLKYVMMKNINATEYDFTRCPKLEKLYLIQNSYEDDDTNKILLDGCEKLDELVLINFWLNDYNFLSSCSSLKKLKLHCNEIIHLTGLEKCTSLEELDITSSELEDISQLSSLINLKRLRIESHKLKDITPLSSCSKLETLNLNNTSVRELDHISLCTKLNRLMLQNTNVISLKPLVGLKELTYVNLLGTSIKNVNVCINWTKLVYLDLSDVVYLKSLKGLGRCSQLKYLYLDNTDIVSLEGLENCKLLETLLCEECTNLRDVSSLFNHTELRKLVLNKTIVRNVDFLSSCTKLTRLILRDNKYLGDVRNVIKNLSYIDFITDQGRYMNTMEIDE